MAEILDLFGIGNTRYSGSPKAYAAAPGSGPAGRTCGDCDHCYRSGRPNPKKAYLKCALVVETHGPGTDIRARTAACSMFKPTREE